MLCPRCGAPMTHDPIGLAPRERCTGCGGGVLAFRDLEQALIHLAPDLPTSCLETPMERVPDAGGGLSCPMCAGAMSHGGYLEQRFVRIDRCVRCMVLFVDDGELEAMAEQRVRGGMQLAMRAEEKAGVFEAIRWRGMEHY